jgi:hypothetical protein
MSTNKILIGGLIGGVILFLAGWLLYGMAFSGFFEANQGSATGVGRSEDEMIFWALIVGNLAGGLLLAIIYGRWASISTVKTGFIAGAVIGLLMGISMDFVMYATTNMANMTAVLVDPLIMAVMWGLGGAGVGWYFGRD